MRSAPDLRVEIFRGLLDRQVAAVLIAEAPGVVSGMERAHHFASILGTIATSKLVDGDGFEAGQEVLRITGTPLQIARAEEHLIGILSKTSGIATAACEACRLAGPGLRVVSGGWKKMPPEMKELVRQAVRDGGIDARMCDTPFVYLDKNYVRIFGDPELAVRAVSHMGKSVVVQLRGESAPIEVEASAAARAGAGVLMVDTGDTNHLAAVADRLREEGVRGDVRLAFGGNVTLEQLPRLRDQDVDLVDIGAAILDAPAVPMRFDVVVTDDRE